MIYTFINIIAWLFGLWSLFMFIQVIRLKYMHENTEKGRLKVMLKAVEGKKYVYPIKKYAFYVIVCAAWLIAYYSNS